MSDLVERLRAALAGRVGSSAQQIIMKIVTDDARPVTELRKSVPPYVGAAVAKALEKLPADRFATAHEFGEALQGRGAVPTGGGTVASPAATGFRPAAAGWRGRLRDPLVLALVGVAGTSLLVAGGLTRRTAAPALPPIQFVVAATDSTKPFDNFPWPAAISPDGGTVVYSVAPTPTPTPTTPSLFALRTDQLEPHPIPGTANGYQPYFSPDGKWLAFESGERSARSAACSSVRKPFPPVCSAGRGGDVARSGPRG